jgi:hypothetical protein
MGFFLCLYKEGTQFAWKRPTHDNGKKRTNMELTPREKDKLLIAMAAMVARVMAQVRNAPARRDESRQRRRVARPLHRPMRRPHPGQRKAKGQGKDHPHQDWKAQKPHHAAGLAQVETPINGQRSHRHSDPKSQPDSKSFQKDLQNSSKNFARETRTINRIAPMQRG